MLVGENVGLEREDIKLVEEECWVGGEGCFGEDCGYEMMGMELGIYELVLGSERSKPVACIPLEASEASDASPCLRVAAGPLQELEFGPVGPINLN